MAQYAWDGRCPSIRAQVLANPARFQELMPAQYAAMMDNLRRRTELDKWRSEALADIDHAREEYTAEIRTAAWVDGGNTVDAELQELEEGLAAERAEVEATYKKGLEDAAGWAAATEAHGKKAAARARAQRRLKAAAAAEKAEKVLQLKAAAEAKEAAAAAEKERERRLLAAEIARETLALNTEKDDEISRLKAELAATKAELATARQQLDATRPRVGRASPALAALLGH